MSCVLGELLEETPEYPLCRIVVGTCYVTCQDWLGFDLAECSLIGWVFDCVHSVTSFLTGINAAGYIKVQLNPDFWAPGNV